ncbi:Alpha/Beta hydrolase protein [Mycena pura]|uniref:Alpha/Beta hydrolase protein n=1 Tax=Mycena pura TaxID=153505 RepID=A0AAD6VSB0_9AGAR|nr:Alpha/Beta hydrolase protein [Mycena pura]
MDPAFDGDIDSFFLPLPPQASASASARNSLIEFRTMFRLPSLALASLQLVERSLGVYLPRDTTGTAQNSTLRWVDCATHVPQPIQLALNVTTSTFPGPLPGTLFCGEIDVPMDYAKPIAQDNQITVGFAMNRPQNPAGLLLFHAGGPGLDAASAAWANALNTSQASTFAGLEEFDFLAVNTRGIQFSNPLNCSANTFFNNISFAFPSTQSEFDQYQAATGKFIQSCVDNSSPPGIVQHVGTAELIQDYDAIRAALGYAQLHFVGVSYGTFVGAAYAAKFPSRVGRFILDAALPHGMPFQDMVTDQVAAINRLLLRADAFCMTDAACPFHSAGKGGVVKAWETVLARALQAPLPAGKCGPGTGCNAPVTATDLRLGASVLFRADPDFPLFNAALGEALGGDASKFAYVPAGDIRETVVVPLLCSDLSADLHWKSEDKSFAAFQALSANSNASDPAQMVYSQIWQFVLMCDAWPFDVPEPATLPTDLPLMWVTSDFDLNLPTELTTFAFAQAPNSTLVIRHGDDHTSIDLPNVASHALEIDFLRTGVFPAAQDGAQVTVVPPGGTRARAPLDPYAVPLGTVAGDACGCRGGILPSATRVQGSVSRQCTRRELRAPDLSSRRCAAIQVATERELR